jgi:hypothetical protein
VGTVLTLEPGAVPPAGFVLAGQTVLLVRAPGHVWPVSVRVNVWRKP